MWFFSKPFPRQNGDEMNRLLKELAQIARTDDFLSERPGGPFDRECRHIRTREIGERIYEFGTANSMEWVVKKIAKSCGKDLAAHLEACWRGIGDF